MTDTEIEKFLRKAGIQDVDPKNTKWKRGYNALAAFQNNRKASKNILMFINKSMTPPGLLGKVNNMNT